MNMSTVQEFGSSHNRNIYKVVGESKLVFFIDFHINSKDILARK